MSPRIGGGRSSHTSAAAPWQRGSCDHRWTRDDQFCKQCVRCGLRRDIPQEGDG